MDFFCLHRFLSAAVAFIWAEFPMLVVVGCFLFAILILKLYSPHPNPRTHHREEAYHAEEDEDEHEMKMKKIIANRTECAICFEAFTADHGDDDIDDKKTGVCVLRECGHRFHHRCLAPWLSIRRFNPTCAKCRCPLQVQQHDDRMEIARVPGSFPMLPHEIMGSVPNPTGHSFPMLPDQIMGRVPGSFRMMVPPPPPPAPISPSSPSTQPLHSLPRLPHQIMPPISPSPPLPHPLLPHQMMVPTPPATISHPPLLPHQQFAPSLES